MSLEIKKTNNTDKIAIGFKNGVDVSIITKNRGECTLGFKLRSEANLRAEEKFRKQMNGYS